MPGQIPWRDPVRGEVLKRALFRLAVAEGIHMKKNRKGTEDIWVSFTALLFKQPEFARLEGSSNSVCTKYTKEPGIMDGKMRMGESLGI